MELSINWKFGGEKEKVTKCLLWISKKFIQTRNFFRLIVGQGRFPLQGKCHKVTKGFAESQICSCRNKIKNTFIEKRQGHWVLVFFGTFRLLLGGSTIVQLPLAKIQNLSHFLNILPRVEIYYLIFSTRWGDCCLGNRLIFL